MPREAGVNGGYQAGWEDGTATARGILRPARLPDDTTVRNREIPGEGQWRLRYLLGFSDAVRAECLRCSPVLLEDEALSSMG